MLLIHVVSQKLGAWEVILVAAVYAAALCRPFWLEETCNLGGQTLTSVHSDVEKEAIIDVQSQSYKQQTEISSVFLFGWTYLFVILLYDRIVLDSASKPGVICELEKNYLRKNLAHS